MFANTLSRCYLYAAVEITTIMYYCFLLVVASSMDTKTLDNIDLPPCALFLAPSTISGTGLGVFAGCAFKQDELLHATWKTLFLPNNFPKAQFLYNYVFGHNETHMALILDYASVINHHESANVKAVRIDHFPPGHELQFQATKVIEPGQEILVRYNSAQWFKQKNIPYSDVDYASTMWRPELKTFPCRENINFTTGADGQRIFSVLDTLPSATVMDVSPCVKVSIMVVDQFLLWDFVLMDTTEQLQICVPLSYAAQIPTTPNPDLANVRVAFFDMGHNVTGSANIMATVVTTQELRAGDSLLRYEEEAPEDDDTRVFSAQSRDELIRAVNDCCRDGILSEDNDPPRLLGPIGNWDVSQVTDMGQVFCDLKSFDYTISNWDVSRVGNMSGMFHNAKSFDQNLSNWDVSKVSDMSNMFYDAISFDQDLSNWDVSKVSDMISMFQNALSFNQDLFKWDVSHVSRMISMFHDAQSFNKDLSNWNVSCVMDMGGMFAVARRFNQDLSNWDVSRVTYMGAMFPLANFFDYDLSRWNVSRVTNMGAMFRHATSFNHSLSNWDVSRVTFMGVMFDSAESFNQDLSNWDVSHVTHMAAMFRNATSFNQDLSNWDVSRVVDMELMFANANSFNQTLCGAAWVNSKALKVDMFTNSPGSISDVVCTFSPQSRGELKRAVDDCVQLPKTDHVSKKQRYSRIF